MYATLVRRGTRIIYYRPRLLPSITTVAAAAPKSRQRHRSQSAATPLPVREACEARAGLVDLLLHLAPAVEYRAVPARAQHIKMQRPLTPLALRPQRGVIRLQRGHLHLTPHPHSAPAPHLTQAVETARKLLWQRITWHRVRPAALGRPSARQLQATPLRTDQIFRT